MIEEDIERMNIQRMVSVLESIQGDGSLYVSNITIAKTALKIAREASDLPEQLAAANTRIEELLRAIHKTLDENGHLADGDNCTLIDLKAALNTKQDNTK